MRRNSSLTTACVLGAGTATPEHGNSHELALDCFSQHHTDEYAETQTAHAACVAGAGTATPEHDLKGHGNSHELALDCFSQHHTDECAETQAAHAACVAGAGTANPEHDLNGHGNSHELAVYCVFTTALGPHKYGIFTPARWVQFKGRCTSAYAQNTCAANLARRMSTPPLVPHALERE